MATYVAGEAGASGRAFDELFGGLAPRVHSFFLRSFDRSVADDLMQTTFLKLHGARGEFRIGQPLRPWLFTIAARVRLDELRRRYRLASTVGEEELERLVDERTAGAQADVLDGDVRDRVRRAVAALPESQRVIVHLHRFEEMTFGEIARVLGASEGAVKLRAFRAYDRLRRALAALGPGQSA